VDNLSLRRAMAVSIRFNARDDCTHIITQSLSLALFGNSGYALVMHLFRAIAQDSHSHLSRDTGHHSLPVTLPRKTLVHRPRERLTIAQKFHDVLMSAIVALLAQLMNFISELPHG
jgi:hypothetical protein